MKTSTTQAFPPLPKAVASTSLRKKVKSEIILGSPSSGCGGVGICRVMLHGENFTCSCRKITAWAMVTESGKLRISFRKSDMDPAGTRQHFNSARFRVTETYPLPLRVMRATDCHQTHITPGVYPVSESASFFTVDF